MSARTLFKSIGSNSLGYVVNVVVQLMLTPFVVEMLGKKVYGLWTLLIAVVGYYGLLDFGVRSAVLHFVATYHARRDVQGVRRTLSTAMAVLVVIALFAGILTVVLAFRLTDWFPSAHDAFLATADPGSARHAIYVLGFGFALSFPMALYTTVLYSVQRIGLQNAIGISQTIVRALLTVWTLRSGHGVLGLSWVAVGTNVLGWIAAIIAAYRVLPELVISIAHCARSSFRELAAYGGYNVLANVGDLVMLYTSQLVIGRIYAEPEAMTWYSIGSSLIPQFMAFVVSVTWAFTPYFTARWATGNVDEVRRLLRVGTRAVVLLTSLIGGGLLLLGREFLAFWQRPEYVSGELFVSSAVILQILTVATMFRAWQSCGRQALYAMREVRYLGLLVLVEALANVLLSVTLVWKWTSIVGWLARSWPALVKPEWADRKYGLVGVALGTLLPVLVTQGFVQPRHLLRELEIDWRSFLFDALRAALPVLATLALVNALLGDRVAITSWSTFFARGTIVATPALLVGFFCGALPEERRTILGRLFGRS